MTIQKNCPHIQLSDVGGYILIGLNKDQAQYVARHSGDLHYELPFEDGYIKTPIRKLIICEVQTLDRIPESSLKIVLGVKTVQPPIAGAPLRTLYPHYDRYPLIRYAVSNAYQYKGWTSYDSLWEALEKNSTLPYFLISQIIPDATP